MYYFSPCPLPADESVVSAWDSELRRIKTPWIEQLLAEQGQELFQRFTSSYNELRALPRNARRALQRKLARSEDGTIPAERRRRLAYSLAGAALLVALGQTVSEAAAPKPTTIKLGTKCSLYNAILSANYGAPYGGCKGKPGPAIIVLPKAANITVSGYLPFITGQITIQGAPAKKPKKGQPPPPPGNGGTISGSGYSLFFVNGGNLTIQNVTLHGSYTTGAGTGAVINNQNGTVSIVDSAVSGTAILGGAIFNGDTLALTRSTVNNSHAQTGGGIYNAGNLTIADSTITGNAADNYSGGGLYNTGSANISNSTISSNTAEKYGGGVVNGLGGTLSISSSTLTENNANKGGAIHNGYNLTVTSSTISDNAANYGGGLFNDDQADATLTSSSVSGNHATVSSTLYNNKTYYLGGYGGGINNHGGLTINSSTINGSNTAEGKVVTYDTSTSYYGGRGGGIHNSSYIYLNNSSVTGNTAMFVAGGVYNLPLDATLQINNSTITGNSAAASADVFP